MFPAGSGIRKGIWVTHINGRRIGPKAETMRFYAVFTGMSEDAILFRSIANETAERVYVIDKESYELFYTSETAGFLCQGWGLHRAEMLHGPVWKEQTM